MIRRIYSIIAVIVLLAVMQPEISAQITAADVFVNAPAGVFPLVDRNKRLDMIDYYRSGSSTPTTNDLTGQSRVTALANDDIKVIMTAASRYQISLLPLGGDTIVALIKTVNTPAPDSYVEFYTTDWEKIDKRLFDAPGTGDWLSETGKKNRKDAEDSVPFVLAGYEYDRETGGLVLTNTMAEYYAADEYERVKSWLKPVLSYRWTGKKMKLVK